MSSQQTIFEGDKFNLVCGSDALVIKYIDRFNIEVLMKSGYKKIVTAERLRHGNIKDRLFPSLCGVGIFGIGKYNKNSRCYTFWSSMIRRVYSNYILTIRPTYIECKVDNDLLNLQDFGKWFDENYIDGYCLDKDLIVPDNKIYSQSNCMFIHNKVNNYLKFKTTKNNKYWNNKHNILKLLIIEFPELERLLNNNFEYFFGKYYD